MSSFVSWAGKVLDSVDEGAASALQKALKNESSPNFKRQAPDDQKESPSPLRADQASEDDVPSSTTGSTVISSKDEQIIGLTKIWNETRDELSRVKAVLRSRDEAHRQAMQAFRDQTDARISDTIQSSSDRISILEQRLQESISNRDLLQSQVNDMKNELEEISKINSSLLQEKDALQMELEQTRVDRSRQIQSLQEEFDEKVKELQDNALAATVSLEQFRNLESKLLSDKELYTNALVDADRELQNMAAAARSAQDEKQKLQAECNLLQAKLNESQLQCQKASASQQTALQQIAVAEERLATALLEQSESFQNERAHYENRISNLSAQLKLSSLDSGLASKADTLQRKVETLTAALLQKQAEIERIGSISSTLGSQLDTERARCVRLEEECRALQQRLSEVINSPDYDDNFKRRRLRPYQHKLTSKLLDFLDGIGTSMARMMRGSARTRMAMAFYIIILHIWVLYILSHLTHQTAPSPTRL